MIAIRSPGPSAGAAPRDSAREPSLCRIHSVRAASGGCPPARSAGSILSCGPPRRARPLQNLSPQSGCGRALTEVRSRSASTVAGAPIALDAGDGADHHVLDHVLGIGACRGRRRAGVPTPQRRSGATGQLESGPSPAVRHRRGEARSRIVYGPTRSRTIVRTRQDRDCWASHAQTRRGHGALAGSGPRVYTKAPVRFAAQSSGSGVGGGFRWRSRSPGSSTFQLARRTPNQPRRPSPWADGTLARSSR
jgi:hypothetical protein